MSLVYIRGNTYEQLPNGKRDLAFVNTTGAMIMNFGGYGFKGRKIAKTVPKRP